MSDLGGVAVVGAGQIGTLVGQGLLGSRRVASVAVFDVDQEAARACLARGGAELLLERPEQALEAEVVVLALPLLRILDWLREFGPRVRAGSLLLDTGSAKESVVEAMAALVPAAAHALGGHPMAGSEGRGAAAAALGSLAGAPFVLSPVREDPPGMELGLRLVRALGARPVVLEAARHDRLVARTSHLPHLVAAALALVAEPPSHDLQAARDLAGSGYRGATRLAASDPRMVAEFAVANREQLGAALGELGRELSRLSAALAGGADPLALELARAGAARARLLEAV